MQEGQKKITVDTVDKGPLTFLIRDIEEVKMQAYEHDGQIYCRLVFLVYEINSRGKRRLVAYKEEFFLNKRLNCNDARARQLVLNHVLATT